MTKTLKFIIYQINKAVAANDTKTVKLYYEILRDMNLIREMEKTLAETSLTLKKAKLYLVKHLDKFPE